jgi:hypothetical protein
MKDALSTSSSLWTPEEFYRIGLVCLLFVVFSKLGIEPRAKVGNEHVADKERGERA